ncbi:CCA tRNA nucleotidyltransferase [Amphibacillus xylanus]|uniref:CCA-adding enzyme n=1 Tax=Amphibacillus xylanus (strain ATCC 51415 / DSM 6626 / JCM 7361 / LMG 17667 / NBRC 15112 / Ep01) TaxID=698758 RepID=K0IY12_AMPXN|nr:CCA tRNA nucleotidyltransferase [Amphibacillus xylanus]BAM47390.1 CCA-adding enzyme [Amphibacillus xylanus NBRC 15112]
MSKIMFQLAFEMIETIKKAGFQAYVVGGAVRDYLLNKEVNDIDIASSATPTQIQEIFDQVIPVGIEHGTVIVRYKHQSFEVTTFRSEQGYSDYRRPDRVTFVNSITDDLARRDFTINAIAMTEDSVLVDPFDGQADLASKMIKAVGNPVERFTEDPLRMLRAIRFVSQLNFNLDRNTWEEIKNNAALIEKLSIERITVEIEKMFLGKALKKAIDYCYQARLFSHLPIFKPKENMIDHILTVEQPFIELIDLFVYLTIITNEEITINQWCQAYKLSNKAKNSGESLKHLIQLYKHEQLSRQLVYHLPSELDDRFISLIQRVYQHSVSQAMIDQIRRQLPITNRREIKMNGHDLQLLYPGKPRGEWIRDYLTSIEEQIIDGSLENDFEKIKEWILKCHPPVNN